MSIRELTFSAAPIAVLIVAVGEIVADIINIGETATGHSLLFGDYVLHLTDLPQFRSATLANGLVGTVGTTSVGLRVLCSLPIAINAIVTGCAGLTLNQIVLRLGDPLERGQDMSRRWKTLAIILIGGGMTLGIVSSVTQVILSTLVGTAAGRILLLGGDYSYVVLAVPHWPFVTIVLGIVAGALGFRLHSGIDPDVRAPVDISDGSAMFTELRSHNRKTRAS